MQDAMGEMSKKAGGHKTSTVKLNNVLMQMRKNCCHPGMTCIHCTDGAGYSMLSRPMTCGLPLDKAGCAQAPDMWSCSFCGQ